MFSSKPIKVQRSSGLYVWWKYKISNDFLQSSENTLFYHRTNFQALCCKNVARSSLIKELSGICQMAFCIFAIDKAFLFFWDFGKLCMIFNLLRWCLFEQGKVHRFSIIVMYTSVIDLTEGAMFPYICYTLLRSFSIKSYEYG